MRRCSPAGQLLVAVILSFSLVVLDSPAGAEVPPASPPRSGPLVVRISSSAEAHIVGDHEAIHVSVTNTGTAPLHDVLAMLSLVDSTGLPATPLGLEDWTSAPEATHATNLLPGASFSGTWRLRMIQAGRLTLYATVVDADDGSVTNSAPIILNVREAHNLTWSGVASVAFSVPVLVLGGTLRLLTRRRRLTEVRALALLAAVGLCAASAVVPSIAAAMTSSADAAAGLRIVMAVAGTPVKTGDRPIITVTVTNTGHRPMPGTTLMLELIDMTPGQAAPLGLETWTSDPESRQLPSLAPNESTDAIWHMVMIQPAPLGLYASVITPNGPILSSRMTTLTIRENRVLNPTRALPIVLGEPLLLLGIIGVVRAVRATRIC